MKTLQDVIAEKRALIEKLQAQLEALEEVAAETGGVRPVGRPRGGRVTAVRRRRAKRSPRGANQEKVLSAMGAAPMRLTDIAKAAGLPLSATNSVIHAAVKKGVVSKGSVRGTYSLKTKKAPGRQKAGAKTKQRAQRASTLKTAKKGRRSSASSTSSPDAVAAPSA
jgi:hypothetical protein